jgi:hypothetical protein
LQEEVAPAAQAERTQIIYGTPPPGEFEIDLKNALIAVAPLVQTQSPNTKPAKGEFDADIKTDQLEVDIKGSTKDWGVHFLGQALARCSSAMHEVARGKSKPPKTN